MTSAGGLFTTDGSSYKYYLSVSEGSISSFTIHGTASTNIKINDKAVSSGTVNETITLDAPSKQAILTLAKNTTKGWLTVTSIDINYIPNASAITNVAGITNDGIYTISSALFPENGVAYVASSGSYLDACGGYKNGSTYPANSTTEIDATSPRQQFAIYTYNGDKYIYNLARNMFVTLVDGSYYKLTGAPSATWTIAPGTTSNSFTLKSSSSENNYAILNAWVGTGKKTYGFHVEAAKTNDHAEDMFISRVGSLTDVQQKTIEELIEKYTTLSNDLTTIDAYTVGTGLGYYSAPGLTSNETKTAFVISTRSAMSNYSTSDLTMAYNTAHGYATGMNINIPNNQFIKINGIGNRYLTMGDGGTRMNFTTAGTILYYSANKILSYPNGLYAGMSTDPGSKYECVYVSTIGSSGRDYAFTESTRAPRTGKYKIGFTRLDNEYRYLYAHNNDNGNADQNTLDNADNCVFTLEEVTSLPITMSTVNNKDYFATINLPVAVTIPDGLSAYKATAYGDVLTLTKVVENGVLAKNVPVILYSTNAVTELAISNETGTSPETGTNELSGTIAAESATGNDYVLGNGGSGVGFYKYTGSVMPGFKAYLPASTTSSNPVKGFIFSFEDAEDAIRAIESENSGLEIYDISGRRVQKAQKGLYIVNGKKVMYK